VGKVAENVWVGKEERKNVATEEERGGEMVEGAVNQKEVSLESPLGELPGGADLVDTVEEDAAVAELARVVDGATSDEKVEDVTAETSTKDALVEEPATVISEVQLTQHDADLLPNTGDTEDLKQEAPDLEPFEDAVEPSPFSPALSSLYADPIAAYFARTPCTLVDPAPVTSKERHQFWKAPLDPFETFVHDLDASSAAVPLLENLEPTWERVRSQCWAAALVEGAVVDAEASAGTALRVDDAARPVMLVVTEKWARKRQWGLGNLLKVVQPLALILPVIALFSWF